MRNRFFRLIYLTAIAVAMFGWIWLMVGAAALLLLPKQSLLNAFAIALPIVRQDNASRGGLVMKSNGPAISCAILALAFGVIVYVATPPGVLKHGSAFLGF